MRCEDLREKVAKGLVISLSRGLFDECLKTGCCEARRSEQERLRFGKVDLAKEGVEGGAEEFLLRLGGKDYSS